MASRIPKDSPFHWAEVTTRASRVFWSVSEHCFTKPASSGRWNKLPTNSLILKHLGFCGLSAEVTVQHAQKIGNCILQILHPLRDWIIWCKNTAAGQSTGYNHQGQDAYQVPVKQDIIYIIYPCIYPKYSIIFMVSYLNWTAATPAIALTTTGVLSIEWGVVLLTL